MGEVGPCVEIIEFAIVPTHKDDGQRALDIVSVQIGRLNALHVDEAALGFTPGPRLRKKLALRFLGQPEEDHLDADDDRLPIVQILAVVEVVLINDRTPEKSLRAEREF
ncbi:hypothetical protein [Mesorhizobium sp. M4B.F.Ca.ET.013.02.1.1]|uniref:hypothetical protein n=1 Tax=Mesorhizobium sp. M4B.F.Ca.ET.013.02.1.1 TaxID=2496755 RepID=UPI00167B80E9|nr:hypothetical protein [Mesorhizobium sp. M4B.F.Ca.ET.013.02.1.1]